MSQAASQAHAFYRQVATDLKVWTVKDSGGFPAPMTSGGKRAMPFWSSLSRAKKIIATVPAYEKFEPVEYSWEEFRDEWLPELEQDGLLVGVNWSGPKALGYDLEPRDLKKNIDYHLNKTNGEP